MKCSECGKEPAKWVSFNVGEEVTRACLCNQCILEITELGFAVKEENKPLQ